MLKVLLHSCVFLLVLGLTACASTHDPIARTSDQKVDLSGSWELDYAQSDNIQAQLNGLMRELRRDAERRAKSQGRGDSRGGPAVVVGSGGNRNTGASIIGLAQMADMITKSQLLEISQEDYEISIKREETFALECEFHEGLSAVESHVLGTEVCGWDDHQLIFRIFLPEGLSIQHRMTLGPSRERLLIASTVHSDQVSYPFTVNRVYNRFDPATVGYRCKQTLTRGRVCTTESP